MSRQTASPLDDSVLPPLTGPGDRSGERPGAIDAMLTRLLVGLTIVSLVALALDVVPSLIGADSLSDWVTWLPMIGFPAAFIVLLVLLARAIMRRRSL
ncbi:hypothetical protein LWF01_02465 [Saxibacter everestensis]|uniref:Uncharacterized protein n=1 Tax=Saxibacter everestensis TaxID=2909229 RepID=A0ABY8QUI9_9MICO|nr:hypothetical protein LWF01_02465 [Brevibacteriaceae bacterium ZFBP1038]